MGLRIPYQMKKIAESGGEAGQQPGPHFDQAWFYQLCELMIAPQAPFVKRQVRKLLLLICGSKEQYRQLRDLRMSDETVLPFLHARQRRDAPRAAAAADCVLPPGQSGEAR